MDSSKNYSRMKLFGVSFALMLVLLLMVNMVTANTPTSGQEETPEVPTEVIPDQPTEVAPETQEEETGDGGISAPDFTQTSCAMSIDDLGDNDPFTYSFSAVNANNIASFAWDFGDSTFGSGSPVAKTYTAPGSYTITLTCTPSPGFGDPIILTGSVFVSQPPSPGFYLTPGQIVMNNGAVTFNAINTSTPVGLSYEWCVTTSPIPPAPFSPGNCPLYYATTTNASYNLSDYGVVHYFYLRAYNTVPQEAVASLSFVLQAPAPSATFSVSPAVGPSPLNIFVDGTDLGTGPLFPGAAGWQYTVTGPGGPYTFLTEDFNMTGLAVGSYVIRLDYAGPGGSGFREQTVVVYATESSVSAAFTVEFEDNVGGGRRVCFTNTSLGEYVVSYWDFENPPPFYPEIPAGGLPPGPTTTPEGGDSNANRVCYVYDASMIGQTIGVRLRVEGNDPGIFSNDLQTFVLQAKPEAHFTWAPATPVWGQWVTFNPDTSTGIIDNPNGYDWQFDFGNNGTIDTTRDNIRYPGDVQLPVGPTRVILTVTGPGGTSTYEDVIIVQRRDIVCNAIGGIFTITPNMTGTQNYTSSVSNVNGPNYGTRTLSYEWTITPNSTPPLSFPITTTNLNGIDWATFGFGSFNISLVVRTNDGAECTRNATVIRDWTPIQCNAIGNSAGSATFFASASPVTYSVNFNSATLNGRPILGYEWFVNGVSQGAPSLANTTLVRNYTNPVAPLNETIRYQVYVDNDGSGTFVPALDATCFEDLAITVLPFPAPTCSISNPFLVTQYADGQNYIMTVTGGDLNGRPITDYTWYVTNPDPGVEVFVKSGMDNTHTHTMTTDYLTHPDFSYRVAITVDNLNGTFTTVDCTRGVGVQPYPTPSCSVTGGSGNPLPMLGAGSALPSGDTTTAQHNHTYNMTFNLNGLSGITLGNRLWSYPVNAPATIVSGGGLTSNNVQVRWDGNQGALPTGNPATIALTVNWTYPNGDPGGPLVCDVRNVNVRVPNVVCNDPTGDLTPLPGDNNIYTRQLGQSPSLGHGNAPIYGRGNFTTWELEEETAPFSNIFVPVTGSPFVLANQTTGANQQFNYSTFAPDTRYRVRYTVDVTADVLDTCTSNWVILVAEDANTGFTCDNFYNGVPNVFTVPNATGDHTVTVNVDNGNGLLLEYRYYLIRPNATETLIFTQQSTADGDIVATIPRTNFAPPNSPTDGNVGNYLMRVEVHYVSGGIPPVTTSCIFPTRDYTVGQVQASLARDAYPGGHSGFAVGTCFNFTNNSTTNSGAPLGDPATNLLHNWTITGGGNPLDNNFSASTFSTHQLAGCISFGTPGNYTMGLTVTNDFQGDTAFRQQSITSNNFRICALQGMGVTRNGSSGDFAFTNQSFTATGLGELTGNYTFTVRRTSDNAIVLGPTSQASATFTFNSLGAGDYRLEVTRNGCLGVASASVEFSLIGTGGIAARYSFLNNINAGVAPLTVCMNDTSVSNGSPIVLWEWDWEGDGTYDYNYNTFQSSATLCHTYATPGIYYPRLRVTNGIPQSATAQNPVRVYTTLEGQVSFNAAPAGGGQWCFTPNISAAPGTVVNYWEFNMNQTPPPPTQTPAVGPDGAGVICHTYGAAGTYYVNMCFTGPAPANEPGCVMRPIIVELPGGTLPNLTATPTCGANFESIFTVSNTGPANMTNPAQVIFYNEGTPILYETVLLNNGQNRVFTFTGVYGNIRMVIGDYSIDVNQACSYAPIVSITAECAAGTPSFVRFIVNNADNPAGINPMTLSQGYTVFDSANNPVTSGTLPNLGDGPSSGTIVTLSGVDPYDTYRIESSGPYGTFNVTQPPCHARPTITVQRFCEDPIRFVFSTNQPMVLSQSYEIFNVTTSTAVGAGSFLLSSVGDTHTATVLTSPFDTYQIRTVNTPNNGYVVPLDVTPSACPVATVNITAECSTSVTPNMPRFILNRTDSGVLPMSVNQTYTVYNNVTNAVVTTGNIPLLPGGGPNSGTIFTVDGTTFDPYQAYRIESNGVYGNFTVIQNPCNIRPTLSVDRTCADPLVLTINSTAPLVAPQGYEVIDTTTSNVVISGIIPAGGTPFPVTLTGQDPYRAYQVRTTTAPEGFVNPLDSTTIACTRPNLVISHDCTMPITFTVENTGGAMLSPSAVSFSGPSGTSIGISTIQLGAGGISTIDVLPTTGINPYAVYTLSIGADFNTNGLLVSSTRDCDDPILVVTNNTCSSYPLTFTVTNNGGAMQVGQPYEVRNSANTVVLSGTLNIPSAGNQVITLSGLTPYDTYTFSSTGFAGTASGAMTNGCVAPVLEVTSTCDFPATFTITNTGGGNMMTPETFTVVDKNGNTVVVAPNSFQLNIGEQFVVTLPTTSDPYGQHTLSSNGFSPVTHTQNCNLPRLSVTASCLFPVQFLVTNTGGDMLVDHTFSVTNILGLDLTPAPGFFRLVSGETYLVNVPVTDLSLTISFNTSTFGVFNVTQITCISGGGITSNPVLDLGIPAPPITPITTDTLLLNRLSLDVLGLPAWSGVPVCGYSCPIFRLYHTNESGDWDIWRLDGADMDNQESFHTNLTERDSTDPTLINAPDVTDIAPSISPNGEWFAFASDRDGNWEIYVAPTSGDLNYAQRVTYNEIAVDTHPVWGPLNYIVYESTRTGNWDLFMVDVVTGREYQLTDSPSNEINAAWASDGSKIVYQSDVSGNWQLYELDLLTMTVRLLTREPNGAWDGAYSPDNARMVYRTVADNGNSVIRVMNLATTLPRSITTEAENATMAVFSPSGRFLAYQSNLDGDLDIYVHEFATGITRQLTDNTIADYAPTWLCGDDKLVFTSDIYGAPNIFEVSVLPITAPALLVEEDAFQLTFEDFEDVYPVTNVPFERASREEPIVMRDTQYPDGLIHKGFRLTVEDTSVDAIIRDDWASMNVCPVSNFAIGGGG